MKHNFFKKEQSMNKNLNLKRFTNFSIFLLLIGMGLCLFIDSVEARSLEQAARSAKDQIMILAQICSGVAIGLGALAFSIGWAQAGRTILISGIVGVFLTVGGPALIQIIQAIF